MSFKLQPLKSKKPDVNKLALTRILRAMLRIRVYVIGEHSESGSVQRTAASAAAVAPHPRTTAAATTSTCSRGGVVGREQRRRRWRRAQPQPRAIPRRATGI